MQQPQLLYRWEVIANFAEYLPLKDLLNTAVLSKQYNQMLKKYIKNHYSLPNHQNQSEFQLLKSLFNRKIYTYNSNDKFARPSPSNFIVRSIECQQNFSVVQTLDSQYKLIKTVSLLLLEVPEIISLPRPFKFVHITDEGFLYCAESSKIYRYNLSAGLFQKEEVLGMKGEIQDLICGYRFTIAVVRESAEEVRLRIFDNGDKLENFKDVETTFPIAKFRVEDNLVLSANANYFIFNQALYEFNVKNATISMHPDFVGKKIVKILGGKFHFIAYERVLELAQNWTTEDVIKFAQKQGFDDFIKILKTEKVTGKTLLGMDKKYMQQVLGIINVKVQQKLTLRLQESNRQNPDDYIIYGWGKTADGALGTNPSKPISKAIKVKLPNDCQIFKLSGLFTFLINKKNGAILVNHIDEKTNKLQWKQVTNKKVWGLSTVDDSIVLIGSANKQRVPQRESEQIVVEKKQKLRTAKNIIDKITWDENLKAEEFKVGYLDKYEGVLEIPFSELEQSQIKEYRIEYFKHGSTVVWDKKKRIDIL